jgi:hypothetical protein
MNAMVKVRFLSGRESRELPREEARKIMEEIYLDSGGGLVFDGKTNRLIYEIEPDTEEIVVLEMIIGGG